MIQQQLASGTFKDASDVLDAGWRLLEAQQQWQDTAQKKIEAELFRADAGRVHEFDFIYLPLNGVCILR